MASSSSNKRQPATHCTDHSICPQRFLIVDRGHSSIRLARATLQPEPVSIAEVLQLQQDASASVVLMCGCPEHTQKEQAELDRSFPAFNKQVCSTDGSDLFVLSHSALWRMPEGKKISLGGERAALVVRLVSVGEEGADSDVRPLAASSDQVRTSPSNNSITIVITKFHLGLASDNCAFQAHHRQCAWDNILAEISDKSQWMIAGCFATNEAAILDRFRNTEMNYSIARSERAHLLCLSLGGVLTTCQECLETQSFAVHCEYMKDNAVLPLAVPAAKRTKHNLSQPTPGSAGSADNANDTDVLPLAVPTAKRTQHNLSQHSSGSAGFADTANDNDVLPLAVPVLKSYADCFITALAAQDDDGNDIAPLLFASGPGARWDERDGCLLVPASTRNQAENKLTVAIQFADACRRHALGAPCSNVSPLAAGELNNHQMDAALVHAKAFFRHRFMDNHELADELWWIEQGTSRLSRQEKDKVKGRFRENFRAFLVQLCGSYHLGLAMIRHGFSDERTMLSMLREVQTAKAQMARARQANPPATKTNNPELWQRTLEARSKFKEGRRVAKRVADESLDRTKLSAEEQTLLEAFHSGVLLATKLEANQAWGFGQGAETKSIEQLAFLDHQIKAYFWAEAEEKKRKAVEAAEQQEAKRRRAVVEMARKRAGDKTDRAARKKQEADDESLSLESL